MFLLTYLLTYVVTSWNSTVCKCNSNSSHTHSMLRTTLRRTALNGHYSSVFSSLRLLPLLSVTLASLTLYTQ